MHKAGIKKGGPAGIAPAGIYEKKFYEKENCLCLLYLSYKINMSVV